LITISRGRLSTDVSISVHLQEAQLHPVADPGAPTGGRDLFYLFNTYADKLRFVVDVDFRTANDYIYMGVRLVDRSGVVPPDSNTRVLFAIRTWQRYMFLGGRYDNATGLLLVNATYHESGWFILATHEHEVTEQLFPSSFDEHGNIGNRRFEAEDNVGVAFAVETLDPLLSGDDPSRRSPFFGINAEVYAVGFESFAPYAVFNLSVSDVCSFFGESKEDTLIRYLDGASNGTLAASEASTTAVGVPLYVTNVTAAVEYYEAALQFVVAGVNTSSVNQSDLEAQTWIMHPLYCLFAVKRRDITVHDFGVVDLQEVVHFLNLSAHYNASEVAAIVGQMSLVPARVPETTPAPYANSTNLTNATSANNSTNLTNATTTTPPPAEPTTTPPPVLASALTVVTVRLRVRSFGHAGLVGGYIRTREDDLSEAATIGLQSLIGVNNTRQGTQFLDGVDNLVVRLLDAEVWRREPTMIVVETTPPPPFLGGAAARGRGLGVSGAVAWAVTVWVVLSMR
jgi:hypothetical protein